MRIVKLVAENFKKLIAIEIIPDKNIIEITGRCEQGKTTILDAIMTALCGTKWDEPIREGQEKARIVVDLGDMIVTRTFTKSGSSLKVETKEGAKYPSPQALLDKLVGRIAFNPLEFAKADAKKQVEMLLAVIAITVDTAKLQEISGVLVQPMPNPLDMLNTAYKTVFESRTVTNRQLDAAKKTLESMPNVSEVKAVSVAELVAEKDELEKQNRANEDKRQAVAAHERQVQMLQQDAKWIQSEIDDLLAKLDNAKARQEAKLTEIKNTGAQVVALQKAAAELQDVDLADVNTRIANADATNLQAKQFADRTGKQAEVDNYQIEADDYTAKLNAIKNYKTEIIANTKFPVEGLGFANGGVTYQGIPFSQASGAQKMRVGMGVGMAANPELRVVMIDGYESLDSTQRRIVEEMAVEHDFQVWCTAVDESGTVGIYIEDGEIKTEVTNG
jgi:DNA repair exonuclease SbcCD ATPase subunit